MPSNTTKCALCGAEVSLDDAVGAEDGTEKYCSERCEEMDGLISQADSIDPIDRANHMGGNYNA